MYASIHFAVEPCLWEISFLRCVHVRARAHLLALKNAKIMRSRDAQCNTEDKGWGCFLRSSNSGWLTSSLFSQKL